MGVRQKFKKKFGEGRSQVGGEGGCQGGCERRIEVFVKMQKKNSVGRGGDWSQLSETDQIKYPASAQLTQKSTAFLQLFEKMYSFSAGLKTHPVNYVLHRALIYDFLYWCLYGLVLEALRSVLETLRKYTHAHTKKTCVKQEK